jgi:hypothetical protein
MTHLCIPRVRIEDVGEKLACHSYTRYDEPVHIEAIDSEPRSQGILLGHSIEVDE